MARSKKTAKRLLELANERRDIVQQIADTNRHSAAAEREERELLEERRLEQQRSEIEAVLPDAGGSTAVAVDPARLTAIAAHLEELRTRGERLTARLREIEEAEHQQIVADLPVAGQVLQDAVVVHRKALKKLGGSVIKSYRAVVSASSDQVDVRREFDLLEGRLKGDRRTVHAQKAALRRLVKDLGVDALPDEILGFLISRALAFSRHSNSGLEEFWRAQGLAIIPKSALYAGAIANEAELFALQSGKLPI